MGRKKEILIFTGMHYEKYGAVERYFIEIAKQLKTKNLNVVFVYNNSIEPCKYLQDLNLVAKYVTLKPNQNLFQLIKKIFQLILKYKPYIVHTHFNPKIVSLVSCIAYLCSVEKRYNTFHGMAQSKKIHTKVWVKIVNRISTKVFAISDAIRSELINTFKASKSKINTLRLGLDETLYHSNKSKEETREEYNLPKNAILIANIAFHNPIKGIDILLEAFSKVIKQGYVNCYLCQIGGENATYTAFLKQKAENLGIEEYIIWMGLQNKVPKLLHAFDIYVQPSRSEGLGLAILEAYYAKLPVIATNIGGVPEIVDSEKGLLFESEDINDLANKTLQLINSKDLRQKKGLLGYNFINKNYNLQKQVKLLLTYY